MGLPVYFCSAALLTNWYRPVRAAGLSVDFLPEEKNNFQGVDAVWKSAIVRRDEAAYMVISSETCRPLGGARPTDLIIHLSPPPRRHERRPLALRERWFAEPRKQRAIAAELERILLASGARSRSFFGCKSIYRCAWPFVDELAKSFKANGIILESTVETDSERCWHGKAVRSGHSISVFIGPAILAETGEPTTYIALAYRQSLLRRESQGLLVREIDDLLVRQRAEAMNFRIVMPYHILREG